MVPGLTEQRSVANGHLHELALKFYSGVKELQDKLPTMYWLPNLHKSIANCFFYYF